MFLSSTQIDMTATTTEYTLQAVPAFVPAKPLACCYSVVVYLCTEITNAGYCRLRAIYQLNTYCKQPPALCARLMWTTLLTYGRRAALFLVPRHVDINFVTRRLRAETD